MAKKNNTFLLLGIGIIVALIVGTIIGSQVFSKTEVVSVPAENGQYCYNENMQGLLSQKEICINNVNALYSASIENYISSCQNSNSISNCVSSFISLKEDLKEDLASC